MTSLATLLKENGPDFAFLKVAVPLAIEAAQHHIRTTDEDFKNSKLWTLFTYDFLYRSIHFHPCDIYKPQIRCLVCKTAKTFPADTIDSKLCDICSTCLWHHRVNCHSIECNDNEAFAERLNRRFAEDRQLAETVAKTFSETAEIVGSHIVFKSRVGIVVASLGKRLDLCRRNLIGEDGRIKQDYKDKILEFVSPIVAKSEPVLLKDGFRTYFVADGQDDNSTFYFMACHVKNEDFKAFMSSTQVC